MLKSTTTPFDDTIRCLLPTSVTDNSITALCEIYMIGPYFVIHFSVLFIPLPSPVPRTQPYHKDKTIG